MVRGIKASLVFLLPKYLLHLTALPSPRILGIGVSDLQVSLYDSIPTPKEFSWQRGWSPLPWTRGCFSKEARLMACVHKGDKYLGENVWFSESQGHKVKFSRGSCVALQAHEVGKLRVLTALWIPKDLCCAPGRRAAGQGGLWACTRLALRRHSTFFSQNERSDQLYSWEIREDWGTV